MNQYGNYECHINLESLTVTAVERHKKLIEIFARDPSHTGGVVYTQYLTVAYIYNTPSVIDSITKIISYLLEPELMQKIVKFSKADTSLKLGELFR